MQVTLRQAHKLVEKIAARLRTITITTSAAINVFDQTDAVELFSKKRAEFQTEVDRQLNLLNARQEIRMSIQSANTQEVNNLVAIRKGLLDELGTYRHIVADTSRSVISSADALKAKIDSVRSSANTSYSADTVSITVVDEAKLVELDRMISQLQLRVEAIEDQLSNANTSTTIVVSDATVAILRREGVVQ